MTPGNALATPLRWWRRIATGLLLVVIVASIVSMPRSWQRKSPITPEQTDARIPPRLQGLVGSVQAWQAASQTEREDFMRWAVDVGLEVQRRKASELIQAQHRARMARASLRNGELFGLLMGLSLLLLTLPFFVKRERIPRRRALWGYTLLATATLVGSLFLLQGCVELLLQATGQVSAIANPEQGLLDASFDRLRVDIQGQLAAAKSAGDDPMPYGPVLGAADNPTADAYLTNILESLQYFDKDGIEPAVKLTRRAFAILSHVPLIVPFLVVLVVLLTMRSTIAEIIKMPLAAARGEPGSGRKALRAALSFIGRELLAVLSLVAVLIPAGVFASFAVRRLTHHLVDLFLAQTRTTVAYFGDLGGAPNEQALSFGLLALPAYLGAATLMGAGGLTLFALRARRLLQQKFHYGWPLRREDKLWRRSFMALLRLQWIPVLLLWVLAPALLGLHAGAPADAAEALAHMTTTGARLAAALPIAFVLFGGIGALVQLWPLRRMKPAEKGAYVLRPSTRDDDDFLRHAHHVGLRPSIEATWGPWDQALQDEFTDTWLERGTAQVILVDDTPVGYLEVKTEASHVFLANIVLLPTAQRQGLGSRIMHDVIEQATAARLPVRLQVMRANPARALYERLGFRVIDETGPHIQMLRPLPPVP